MREPSTSDRWRRSGSFSWSLALDALAIGGFVLLANGVLFAPLTPGPFVRALVGLPLLFVVPGYAIVSALFPARRTLGSGSVGGSTRSDHGVCWRERVALAVGTSVAILPLLGLALPILGLGYGLPVVAGSLSAVAVVLMGVAVVRRNRLPAGDRFRVPTGRWLVAVDRGLSVDASRSDVALNVGLAVVVVASLGGVAYAVTTPNDAETFVSATLLTENEEGDRVASGYAEAVEEPGGQLVVRLANDEGETTTYTVVGELQRLRSSEGSRRIVEREEVLRTSTTLDDRDVWTRPHTVQSGMAGEDLRLIYYVYRGEAPPNPSVESAHSHVYVWIDLA